MATLYGAGAYTGSNPIGGGNGYVSAHGYTQAGARYVVTTAAQLQSALSSATSGQVIWIPSGTTITWSSQSAIGTLREGAVLASNRGQGGAVGGKIKWTVADPGSFMGPLLRVSSRSVVSGLVLEGASPYREQSNRGPCAIRGGSVKRVEVENCHISNFSLGGIWFDPAGTISPWNSDDPSTGRHWIHHCYIGGIQQHGEGYGVGEQGAGGSMLVEACEFGHCRHAIMVQESYTSNMCNSAEIRYCRFADGRYASGGNPSSMLAQHQVDAHGHGVSSSYYSCNYYWIHHCDFSENVTHEIKVNVGIRGWAKTQVKVWNNWTKKKRNGQSGLFSETVYNGAFTALAAGGGALSSGYLLSNYRMVVENNWYGPTAPPGGVVPGPDVESYAATNVQPTTATLNGNLASLGSASSGTVAFEWGKTASYGNTTPGQVRSSTGAFSAALSGLEPDTTYHFRAKLVVGTSNYYGADLTFKTAALPVEAPVVRTDPAQNIYLQSARLHLELLSMGTATSVQLYWQYGLTAAYGYETSPKITRTTAPQSCQQELTGLEPATAYHFRAVVVGNNGKTAYGADRTFTTEAVPRIPVCLTLPAEQVTQTEAMLRGRVEGISPSTPVVEVGFRWGLSADALTSDAHWPTHITGDGPISYLLYHLDPDTTYYYQAYMRLG